MPLSPCRSPPLIARRSPPATGGPGAADPAPRQSNPADLLACIRRMALLQIDTISVVARSPYLVLFSRLGHYDPRWLEQLLADGDLFEYWAHEACFVPGRLPAAAPSHAGSRRHGLEVLRPVAQDPRRRDSADSGAHSPGWPGAGGRLRAQGDKGNGWWDWKPEKRHLEVLFTAGQLMVRERRNFQRVYDLAERVMPEWNDERDLPSPDLARRDMVRASCRALGLVKTGWVADYYRLKRGNTTPCSTSWRTRGAVAGTSGGVAARSLRSRLPGR